VQGNVYRKALKHIADEVDWVQEVDIDKSKCGCWNRTTYELLCACLLDMTIKKGKSICLSEIRTHLKRLSVDDADVKREGRPYLSLLLE
jgi:hypothetical protein